MGESMEFEDILELLQSDSFVLREKGACEIFKNLEQPLIGFCMQRKLNRGEAEDVTLTSLTKICKKSNTVEDSKRFKSWCWEVARNTLLDHFLKYKKYKNEVSEEVLKKSEVVERVLSQKERKIEIGREECVKIGVQEFGRAMPEREYWISMWTHGVSYQQLSLRMGRTLAGTKEYISQCKKKLEPFIEHCIKGDD